MTPRQGSEPGRLDRRPRCWSASRRSRSRTLLLAAVLLAGLGLCACSQPGDQTTVDAVTVPGAGRVLATGAGSALYVYLPDHRGRPTCVSACASAWPPLVLPAGTQHPIAGPGIDRALLSTTTRPGGSRQITYNHWPLYRYVGDGPRQVDGQAEGMGAWYLLSTSGAVDRLPVPPGART